MKQKLLLYRGDNPLFKRLSEELASEGFTAESVPMDDDRVSSTVATARKARENYLLQIRDQYTRIFTDHSMFMQGFDDVINVYRLVNSDQIWPEQIRVIADRFKREGRTPVINPFGLTHHLNSTSEVLKNIEDLVGDESAKEYKKRAEDLKLPSDYENHNTKSVYLASLLGEVIDVRVIPYASQKWGQEEEGFVMARELGDKTHKGNITDALRKMDIDPKGAVILVDHHVYNLREGDVKSSGFDQVDIYPICVCCYGLDPKYRNSLEEKGFHVVGSEIESDIFYPQLLNKIMKQ